MTDSSSELTPERSASSPADSRVSRTEKTTPVAQSAIPAAKPRVRAEPGETWRCEPWITDKPNRPWVTLTRVMSPTGEERPRIAPGTLIYGTTQPTAADRGSPHKDVSRKEYGVTRNGLDTKTLFIGTNLAFAQGDGLARRMGVQAGDDFPRIKRLVHDSIGFGKAPQDNDEAAASWRGIVVKFDSDAASIAKSSYGVVVTAHAYSKLEYYQLVVPLYPFEPEWEDPDYDVANDSQDLNDLLGAKRSVFAVSYLMSIFHRDDLATTGQPLLKIGDTVMKDIETRLYKRLGLHDVR